MNEELRNHIINLLNKGVRLDGRKPLEYRKPVDIKYDFSKSAEGSARVQIGETVVIAGVKLATQEPYPDSPEEGCLMVNAELLPISNPEFETGPPGIDAIEISRVVDRGIRESKAIDMKKLCVEKGEKVWSVMIDICPLNDAGNLFDISALSALAALKNTKFPKTDKEGTIDYKNKTDKSLSLDKQTVSVTVCKIGDHLIVDPITEEEKVIDARMTIATDQNQNLCAMQKGGDSPLTEEEISKMVDIGVKKCDELRKAL
ncbi:exosome complex protein Rrp42 [Candidatus Woesearchaeota archaeon]|nr:exosome complex protein Rrp42 [Candidatus Woesearchaeota archaeon]